MDKYTPSEQRYAPERKHSLSLAFITTLSDGQKHHVQSSASKVFQATSVISYKSLIQTATY